MTKINLINLIKFTNNYSNSDILSTRR